MTDKRLGATAKQLSLADAASRFEQYPFAAYYFDRADGEQQWGLRSLGFDVSAVAKSLGGGGHQRASGFVKNKVTR